MSYEFLKDIIIIIWYSILSGTYHDTRPRPIDHHSLCNRHSDS